MPNVIDKIAWVPVHNRAVLFAKSRGRDLFYTIGGKRKAGESDADALCREVMEEAKVSIIRESIREIAVFEGTADGRADGTIVRLTCYDAEYEGELTPSAEVELIEPFTTHDMERTTPTGRKVLAWFRDRGLID